MIATPHGDYYASNLWALNRVEVIDSRSQSIERPVPRVCHAASGCSQWEQASFSAAFRAPQLLLLTFGSLGLPLRTVQWRNTESNGVQTPPTVVRDHVLVADYDDVVYCFSATTGGVEWEYSLPNDEPFCPNGILSNGTRTVVYGDGGLVAF